MAKLPRQSQKRPIVAIHKFSSCDGCQLAFLNAGEALLSLAAQLDIKHFAEAGLNDEEVVADIAFVEGSISTEKDLDRIKQVRENSRYVITLGACATAGGLQALRNFSKGEQWPSMLYTQPEYIDSLADSTAIEQHIRVDMQLWGCPVNGEQVIAAIKSLLHGVVPDSRSDKVCLECKRSGQVCVMVTQDIPCLGPVTRSGCGAICPRFGRDCYGCFGPAENANADAMGQWLEGLGLMPEKIAHRFHFINSAVEPNSRVGKRWHKVALNKREGGRE